MTGAALSPIKYAEIFDCGFTDLVSVIPPAAMLSPRSKIQATAVGKIPGHLGADGWVGYDWLHAPSPNRATVEQWEREGASLGLLARRFPAIDLDVLDAGLVARLAQLAERLLGWAPMRTGRAPKQLLLYRTDTPFPRKRLHFTLHGEKQLIEVLGEGQQLVVAGIHPGTGQPYDWAPFDPGMIPAAHLSVLTAEKAADFLTAAADLLATIPGVADVRRESSNARADAPPQASLVAPLDQVRAAVACVPNTTALFPNRSDYLTVGYAIKAALPNDPDAAFDCWLQWCGRWEDGYNDPETAAGDWSRMKPPFAIGAPWLFDMARGHGYPPAVTEFEVVGPPHTRSNAAALTKPGREKSANQAQAITRRLSDVQPKQVQWLSPGRIPFGKLTVLEGDPGLGKSTVLLDLAARLTRGEGLPGDPELEPADVILLTAEDGLADTVRPRLEAAGAVLAHVHSLEGFIRDDGVSAEIVLGDPAKPASLDVLERLIGETGARLVVVDVLTAFLSGARDSYKDHDMRAALRPLAALAERTGCAIIVVRHLRKSGGGKAINAGGGSIAIGGAARSVLLVDKDPGDEERRVLASVKCNLAPAPASLAFRLVGTEAGASRIEWLGRSEQTAESLTEARASNEGEAGQQSKVEECAECLREWLTPSGMERQEVLRLAREAGYYGRTVERARVRIGLVHRSTGFGTEKRSVWSLPSILSSETIPAYPDSGEGLAGMAVDGRNGPSEGHAEAWVAEMLR